MADAISTISVQETRKLITLQENLKMTSSGGNIVLKTVYYYYYTYIYT